MTSQTRSFERFFGDKLTSGAVIAGLCASACATEADVWVPDDDERKLVATSATREGSASDAAAADAGLGANDTRAAAPVVDSNTITLDAGTAAATDAALIKSVSFFGSGCSESTGIATIAPDRASVSLQFHEFSLETGAGALSRNGIRNCGVSIRVTAPKKHAVTLKRLSGQGSVELPQSVGLDVMREYRFLGAQEETGRHDEIVGTELKNFRFSDAFAGDEPGITTACGVPQVFVINVRGVLFDLPNQVVSSEHATAKLTELSEIAFELRECE